METEAPKIVLPIHSLQAAPFTSKLLGNSHINLKKFAPYTDFSQSTTNFENFEHFEHFNAASFGADSSKSKSILSFTKMLNGKIEDLKQKRTMDGGPVKQVHKTAKFAMIFKLKKEEVKQMLNGDTTILKSCFKNMSSESVLKPENFEIMSEQNLQTIIENIRQAASVLPVEGAKKRELPFGVWSTGGTKQSNVVHKQHLCSSTSKHTQCEYTSVAVDSGFHFKPLKALTRQQSPQPCHDKATQYEPVEQIKAEKPKETVAPRVMVNNKAIQCELLTPARCRRSKSKSTTKLVHKSTQSESLRKPLSETSIRLLQQDIAYSKQIGEELSRSLHESQDSLEILRRKFPKKLDEPRSSSEEAGEVQASEKNDDLGETEEWCEAIDHDENEYGATEYSDSAQNTVVSPSESTAPSPVQFDDSVFAFLDEIYSDLSLSEGDDFRTELKSEIKNMQKGILRHSNGSSKIPKPCLKRKDDAPIQLICGGSEDSITGSEIYNSSTESRATSEERNSDGTSKHSKIPVSVGRKFTSQHQLHKQGTKLSATIETGPTDDEPCQVKNADSMRQARSMVSLNADQKTSLTYMERQRQLIEIIVKGVEQELKSYD